MNQVVAPFLDNRSPRIRPSGQGIVMKMSLLVIRGQPQGKHLLFPRGEYLIGRGDECHIRPNSEWVSRQHCLLRVLEKTVSIQDLGSMNGTLVNGIRILEERLLNHGDRLQVGPLVFEVRLAESLTTVETTPLPYTSVTSALQSTDSGMKTEEMTAVKEPALVRPPVD